MHKEFLFNEECTKSLLTGAQIVAQTVGTTFGANGRKVIIEKRGQVPKHTKDGVSVAREIILENKFDNLSAESLIEVAMQMLNKVGDGTTTAILLAEAFLELLITYDPSRETMDKFKEHINLLIELFENNSISGEDPDILEGVAYISSNGDKEITSLLREAINHIGKDGNILVDASSSSITKVKLEDGIHIPFGFSLQEFANNKIKMTGEYNDCYLVLYDGRIENFDYTAGICKELVAKEALTPIVFIASHFSQDALAGLGANVINNVFSAAAISIDGEEKFVSELLEDLSAATGVPIFGRKHKKPLGKIANSVTLSQLKKVEKIKMTRDSTIILPFSEEIKNIDAHLNWLKTVLENTEDEKMRINLSDRIGRVSQKIAIMQVGGATRQTMLEKRDRIEDAVCAVLQARKKGVLPGGGLPFIMAIRYLNSETDLGAEIIKRSILKVLWRLYYGSGWEIKFSKENESINKGLYRPFSFIEEYTAIEDLLKRYVFIGINEPKKWIGLNLETNKEVVLFDAGIFDPTSVITTTLNTAAEFALNLMKTGASIIISRKLDIGAFDPQANYNAN